MQTVFASEKGGFSRLYDRKLTPIKLTKHFLIHTAANRDALSDMRLPNNLPYP